MSLNKPRLNEQNTVNIILAFAYSILKCHS